MKTQKNDTIWTTSLSIEYEDDDYKQRESQEEETDAELEDQNFHRAGIKALLGGISIQLFNGCYTLWANISGYVVSYYYQFDQNVGQGAIFYVDIAMVLLCVFGYQFGTYLLRQKNWNPKAIILLGGTIAISGIAASSFAQSFGVFLALYGVFGGVGIGITYMIPLVCCMEYFPNNRGLITGIIVGSFGLGSVFCNLVASRMVNPEGDAADIKTNDPNLNVFRPEIANRVPTLLRQLCVVWYCLVLTSAFLISKPPKNVDDDEFHSSQISSQETRSDEYHQSGSEDQDQSKHDEINLVRPYACLHSLRFKQYFVLMFLANIFGCLFTYQYKTIFEAFHDQGEEKLNADMIMSWAAILSGVTQLITRFSVGHLYDRFGFKAIFKVLMFINAINALIVYQVKMITWLYFICIQLNFFVLAGVYAIFPAAVVKTFGIYYGPQVYCLVNFGGVFSSWFSLFSINFLYGSLNFSEGTILAFGSVASLIALAICQDFEEEIDFENMNEKGLLVINGESKETKEIEIV